MTENVRKMAQFVKTASDPASAMKALAANNPQIREVLDIAGNAPTLKAAFFTRAKQLGVDPGIIIKSLS